MDGVCACVVSGKRRLIEKRSTCYVRAEDFGPTGPFVNSDHVHSDGPRSVADGKLQVLIVGLKVVSGHAIVDNLVEAIQNFFGDFSVFEDFEKRLDVLDAGSEGSDGLPAIKLLPGLVRGILFLDLLLPALEYFLAPGINCLALFHVVNFLDVIFLLLLLIAVV